MRWWWLSVFVLVLSGVAFALQGQERTEDDDCPCLPMDQCPRVYGQSATDVRELGFLKPCRHYGTVRCCGVTIRIEHEKDADRQVIRRPNRIRSSALKRVPSTANQGDLQAAGTQTIETAEAVSESPSPTVKIRPLLKFRTRKVEPSLRSGTNDSQTSSPVEEPKSLEPQQPVPFRIKALTPPRTLRKPQPPPLEPVSVSEEVAVEETKPAPPVVSLLPKSRPSVNPVFKLRRPGGLKVGIQVDSSLPTTVEVLTPGEKLRGVSAGASRKESSKTTIELGINVGKRPSSLPTALPAVVSPSLSESEPIAVVAPRPRPPLRRRPTNKASELIGLGTSTKTVILEPVTPAPIESTTSRLRRPMRPGLRRRPVTPVPVLEAVTELETPVLVSSLFEPTAAPFVPVNNYPKPETRPAPFVPVKYYPKPETTPAPFVPVEYYPKPETTPVPDRRPKYKQRARTTTTTEHYEETTLKEAEYEQPSTEITTTTSTTTPAPETTVQPFSAPVSGPYYEHSTTLDEARPQYQPEAPSAEAVNYGAEHEQPIKIQIQPVTAPQTPPHHYYIGGSEPDDRIVSISQPSQPAPHVPDVQIHYETHSVPENHHRYNVAPYTPHDPPSTYEHRQEEPLQPVQVTSTYSRIRHGDGQRPGDYQHPAPTYYQQPTQRPSSTKPLRRFQAPTRFNFPEDDGSYVHEPEQPAHSPQQPVWERAENYDLVVDQEAKKAQPAPYYHQSPPNVASYVYTRKPDQQPSPQRYEEETYSHPQAELEDYADEYEEFQEESRVNAAYVKPDEGTLEIKQTETPVEGDVNTQRKKKRVRITRKPVEVDQQPTPKPSPLPPNPLYPDTRAQILNRKRFQAKLPPISSKKNFLRVKAGEESEKASFVFPAFPEHGEIAKPTTPLPSNRASQQYPSVITAEVQSSPAPVQKSYTDYYNHQIPPTETPTQRPSTTTPIPLLSYNSPAEPDTRTTTVIDIQAARTKEPDNQEPSVPTSVQTTKFRLNGPQPFEGFSYEIRKPVQQPLDYIPVPQPKPVKQLPNQSTIVSLNTSPDPIPRQIKAQLPEPNNAAVLVDIVGSQGTLAHEGKHPANSEAQESQAPQRPRLPETSNSNVFVDIVGDRGMLTHEGEQEAISEVRESPTPQRTRLPEPSNANVFVDIVENREKFAHAGEQEGISEAQKSEAAQQLLNQQRLQTFAGFHNFPNSQSRPDSAFRHNVEQPKFFNSHLSGPSVAEGRNGSTVVPSSFQTFINIVSEAGGPSDSAHPSSSDRTGERLTSAAAAQPQPQTQWNMPQSHVSNQAQLAQSAAPLKTEIFEWESARPELVPQVKIPASSRDRFEESPQPNSARPAQERPEMSGGHLRGPVQVQPPFAPQSHFSGPAPSQFSETAQGQFSAPPQGQFSAPAQIQFSSPPRDNFKGQLPAEPQGVRMPSNGQFTAPSNSHLKTPDQAPFERFQTSLLQGQFNGQPNMQLKAPFPEPSAVPSQGQFNRQPSSQNRAPTQGQFSAPSQSRPSAPSQGQFTAPSKTRFPVQSQGQSSAPSTARFPVQAQGQFSEHSAGQFSSPPRARFPAQSQGQISAPSQGQISAPSQGQFSAPSRAQFNPNPQGHFQVQGQNQFRQSSQQRPLTQINPNRAPSTPSNPRQPPHQFHQQIPQVDISFNSNGFNRQGPSALPRPSSSQPTPKEPPQHFKEYEQHQFFTQQILSQLQNTVRKARAANLTDTELEVLLRLDKEMRTNSSGLTEAEVTSEIKALSRSLGLESGEEDEPSLPPTSDTKSVEDNWKNGTSVAVAEDKPLTSSKNGTQTPEELVKPADTEAALGEKSESGGFRAPKTIQRGFFPILPYSETDPGLLLVNMKGRPRVTRSPVPTEGPSGIANSVVGGLFHEWNRNAYKKLIPFTKSPK